MRANSASPNSSKRRSNFLIPSIAGTSKSVSNKKVFSNLTPTQQFEALHQVANEQVSKSPYSASNFEFIPGYDLAIIVTSHYL